MLELLPAALVAVARDVCVGLLLAVLVALLIERVARFAEHDLTTRYEAAEPVFEVVDAWAGIDEARLRHPMPTGEYERRAA